MKNISDKTSASAYIGVMGVDTMFVLFFLAQEYGRAVTVFSVDGLLMGITMAMVLVLPYFLPSQYERPAFANWIFARTAVALAGGVSGIVLKQGVGVVLPDVIRFLPMTFLILAAMVSCYIQFYGLMKLRLAK